MRVAHEQILFKSKLIINKLKSVLSIKKDLNSISVFNKNLKVVFDKNEGRITSYIFKEKELLHDKKGLKPNFWPAITDNDLGNKIKIKNLEWKKASLFSKVIELDAKILKNGSVKIKMIYGLPGVKTIFESTYIVYGNGLIHVKNVLNKTEYKGGYSTNWYENANQKTI